jgi:hypothetical protein
MDKAYDIRGKIQGLPGPWQGNGARFLFGFIPLAAAWGIHGELGEPGLVCSLLYEVSLCYAQPFIDNPVVKVET